MNLDAGGLLRFVRFFEIEPGGAIDLDAFEADLLDQFPNFFLERFLLLTDRSCRT